MPQVSAGCRTEPAPKTTGYGIPLGRGRKQPVRAGNLDPAGRPLLGYGTALRSTGLRATTTAGRRRRGLGAVDSEAAAFANL